MSSTMRTQADVMMAILEEEKALLADGFENALVGYTNGYNIRAVYDYSLCVHILIERDDMTYEDALEHMEFNVVGAYVGEKTPLFITPCVG